MSYKVVVVGATGNVGREMLNILDEREFPIAEIAVLASRKSLGTEVSFGDKTLKTTDLASFDFAGWDMALFAVGSEATKEYAPKAAAAGCIVIDNSSLYRYDPEVPLIVPEVNADAIFECHKKNIIANPNCSTAQMVVALKPLHDRAKIKRVVVSTYQSVSGAGKEGIDELWDQTKSIYNPVDNNPPTKFTKQIAFNKLHGIEPKGVQKRIKDIIDGVYDVKEKRHEMQVEQERARYEDMSEKDLAGEIKRLEKQMNAEAKNLEFEKAASTRDRLTKVKEMAFGARSRDFLG